MVKKKSLVAPIITLVLYLGLYSIPALVFLEVIDMTARTLSLIFLLVLVFVGGERLYASLKNNCFWTVRKR